MCLPDQQAAFAHRSVSLTGRHKAPTGVPASTNVRVGGEETPSRQAVTNLAGERTSQAGFKQDHHQAT
jgi:hypothetical protein